jgi:cellulose synthase/poly-beta-1,6-N-acetylglucosamine synthase-like glycosyltransferase
MTAGMVVGFCVGAVLYSYLVFPLLLALVPKRATSTPKDPEEWPTVAVLLSVFNEEKHIGARLANFFSIDYPANRLEFLVGSDGSTDATDAILARCDDPRLRYERLSSRGGKPRVLNRLVGLTQHQILVFTDANTMFAADALKRLVRHFSDPAIGGVCGKLLLEGNESETDESIYWRLETYLKTRESALDSCLGANGGIYAIRRALWPGIPNSTFADDFVIGMRIRENGSRVIYDPEAVAVEDMPEKVSAEFARRVRIGAGGYQALFLCWRSLLPWRGLYTWAFWSHKVLRWFGPFFMLGAIVANVFMLSSPLAIALLCMQVLFYGLAFVGAIKPGRVAIFSVPHYFVAMNYALFLGFGRFVTGRQRAAWKRTAR